MSKIYFPYDYGEAIIKDGVGYIRTASGVEVEATDLLDSADQQDIGDNTMAIFGDFQFNNSGRSFQIDNTAPLSSGWTLEQCAIACVVPDYTSLDWSAGTLHKTFSDISVFFTAPSAGELRIFKISGGGEFYIGQNGQKIGYVGGADLDGSTGLRVSAGDAIQCAEKESAGALVGGVDSNVCWAFLPDSY